MSGKRTAKGALQFTGFWLAMMTTVFVGLGGVFALLLSIIHFVGKVAGMPADEVPSWEVLGFRLAVGLGFFIISFVAGYFLSGVSKYAEPSECFKGEE